MKGVEHLGHHDCPLPPLLSRTLPAVRGVRSTRTKDYVLKKKTVKIPTFTTECSKSLPEKKDESGEIIRQFQLFTHVR